jgi:hypothetical protein
MKKVDIMYSGNSYEYAMALSKMLEAIEKLFEENRGKTFLISIEEVEEIEQ